MSIKKFYYYLYYRVYHFAIKISDDALNEIKPGIIIIILELLIAIQCFIWLELFQLIPKRDVDLLWSKPILIGIVLLIVVFNYYVFLYREKWKRYNKEFEKYNTSKKQFYNFFVVVIIILILSSFIFSFYMLYSIPA